MDVTGVAWRTSSYSSDNGGTCFEVGTVGPAVAVRDSKHLDGPRLAFAVDTWKAFTEQMKRAQDLVQVPAELFQFPGESSTPLPTGRLARDREVNGPCWTSAQPISHHNWKARR